MNKIMLILITSMFALGCEDCGNGNCNNNKEKKDPCKKEECRRHRRW